MDRKLRPECASAFKFGLLAYVAFPTSPWWNQLSNIPALCFSYQRLHAISVVRVKTIQVSVLV